MKEVLKNDQKLREARRLKKASRSPFSQPGSIDKMGERRAAILGRPKIDRVFLKTDAGSNFWSFFNAPMKICSALFVLLFLQACQISQFTTWQQEVFEETPITASVTKTLSFRNENQGEVQTVSVGFDSEGDARQHFRIDKVAVGNRVVGTKNIVVPPGSSVNIQVTYEPRNLETTQANFGGWVTGEEKRFEPFNPNEEPPVDEEEDVWHRIVLLAVYNHPKAGISQIELVGKPVPGPNGEISLPELGATSCEAGEGVACLTGNFSVDVPKLFTTGPKEEPLLGPIRFQISGSVASLRMEDMPPVILILKGNGPGEPLEGQPVSAVSVIVRGLPEVEAQGSFDGNRLELSGLAFRVQVVIGEVTAENLPQAQSIVDFQVEGLTLTTEVPLTDGRIGLLIDTTLSQTPSGNPIFDDFLGGAQILVRFAGALEL